MPAQPEVSGCASEASGSLGVALSAEPSDTTISVHPVINIGLAVKAGDFSGFSARYSATIVQSSSELRTGLKVTFVFAMGHYAGNTFKREPALWKSKNPARA